MSYRAAVAAGKPQVICPVGFDQPFWAGRLHRLGVAPQPLPMAQLSADNLASALRACLDEPAYRDRAAALASRIRTEDGAAAVLSLIERLSPPG